MQDGKTIGQHSLERLENSEEVNPIDLQKEMLKKEDSYENQVRIAVSRGLKLYKGDFYIIVLNRKDRLFRNIIRLMYFPRQSCPRTEYDQTVYKYHRNDERLELLWTIPDLRAVQEIYQNKGWMADEYKQLIEFVIRFKKGDLDRLSDRLNSLPGD